jgi:hypothetical protein
MAALATRGAQAPRGRGLGGKKRKKAAAMVFSWGGKRKLHFVGESSKQEEMQD